MGIDRGATDRRSLFLCGRMGSGCNNQMQVRGQRAY
jgi:hypothetical protein